MRLSPGTVFDRYTIEGVLGHGGMGEVYRARDTRLERSVALKLLRAGIGDDDAERARGNARLLEEARAAAALQHANVVAIHDVGEHAGVPFIAMELVPGTSLRRAMEDGGAPVATKIRWLTEIGAALSAAHRRGLIHRDIKPENVMVREDGVIKVLDFGIAHRARSADGQDAVAVDDRRLPPVTGTETADPWMHGGGIVGTPRYMSPEQLRGDALDAGSDQFSWGVLAYELFTGRAPWGGDAMSLTLVSSMLSEEAVPREALLATAPPGVAKAILRSLSKERVARFATMDDAVAALHQLADAGARVGGLRWRRRAGVALSVAVGLTTIVLVAIRVAPRHSNATALSDAVRPSETAVTRLTDLPVPSSNVAEARAEYVAGLQALHDGSVIPAVRHFAHATEIDPAMAAAHLRLATHGRNVSDGNAAAHFAKAREMRAVLTPRDQALLGTLEPVFLASPPDERELTRRITETAARWPNDCELSYLAITRDEDPARMESRLLGLASLDPGFALVLWRAANIPLAAGNYAHALELLDRCVGIAADSTSCLSVRALIYEETGRCTDMEKDARLLERVAPTARAHDLVARVLLANGAPAEAVRQALERKWSEVRGAERDAYQHDDESHLAILAGDFVTAERIARESLAAVARSADEDDQKNVYMPLVALDEEMGKTKEAAVLAARYLDARASWQSAGAWSPLPQMLEAAEHGGLRTPREREQAMAGWLELWKNEDLATQPQSWILGYAIPATSPPDGEAALRLAPRPLPRAHANQFHHEGLGAVGKALLLGGRPAEAVPELRAATASCSALQAPLEHTRAYLFLGEALERTGDTPGACRAYGAVLQRWGAAVPRSVTADAARARRKALACR